MTDDDATEQLLDTAPIVRALREMNAAENSYRRAFAEFSAALPPGIVLLHRKLDEEDGPGKTYWSYEKNEQGLGYNFGVDTLENVRKRAVIVAAPGPRDELLPRLSEGQTATRPLGGRRMWQQLLQAYHNARDARRQAQAALVNAMAAQTNAEKNLAAAEDNETQVEQTGNRQQIQAAAQQVVQAAAALQQANQNLEQALSNVMMATQNEENAAQNVVNYTGP